MHLSALVVGLLRKENAFAVIPTGNMGRMTPGVIFTFRDERQIAELRSGDCSVAENVMLMLLDISSEEEARLQPFFMLLQSL